MYNKETEPCSAKAKCDFRSFRAVQSFWTKQQRFISKKVGHQKWCPFFYFVCFSGCHFTKGGFFQKLARNFSFFFQKSFIYIIIIHISKVFCQFNFFYCFLGFFALCLRLQQKTLRSHFCRLRSGGIFQGQGLNQSPCPDPQTFLVVKIQPLPLEKTVQHLWQSSSNLLTFEAAGPVFKALVPPVRALITFLRSGLHVNAIRFINCY